MKILSEKKIQQILNSPWISKFQMNIKEHLKRNLVFVLKLWALSFYQFKSSSRFKIYWNLFLQYIVNMLRAVLSALTLKLLNKLSSAWICHLLHFKFLSIYLKFGIHIGWVANSLEPGFKLFAKAWQSLTAG